MNRTYILRFVIVTVYIQNSNCVYSKGSVKAAFKRGRVGGLKPRLRNVCPIRKNVPPSGDYTPQNISAENTPSPHGK